MADKGLTGVPPSPPVPQWLLTSADAITEAYVTPRRPKVSLYGLVYAAYIAGWEAAHEQTDPGSVDPPVSAEERPDA